MVIQTIDKRNGNLKNVLDVDLKITYLKIFQIHQKITINGKSKNVLMKKVIVHATMARITVTKRYMHLRQACLVMTNILVENLVTVHN